MKLFNCYFEVINESQAETFSEQKIGIGFKEYDVIKQTDKTYTIETTGWNKEKRNYFPRKRVILKDQSGKRFAYSTKERALEAFKFKRLRYNSILKSKIKYNERLIEVIKNTII